MLFKIIMLTLQNVPKTSVVVEQSDLYADIVSFDALRTSAPNRLVSVGGKLRKVYYISFSYF